MADIDRSSPLNHNYDHTDASLTPTSFIGDLVEKAKKAMGIGVPHPDGPVSLAPGHEGKTPQQIADEMSE